MGSACDKHRKFSRQLTDQGLRSGMAYADVAASFFSPAPCFFQLDLVSSRSPKGSAWSLVGIVNAIATMRFFTSVGGRSATVSITIGVLEEQPCTELQEIPGNLRK